MAGEPGGEIGAEANEMCPVRPLTRRALLLAGGGQRVALLAGQGLAVEISPAVLLDDDDADSGLRPEQVRGRLLRRDAEALVETNGDRDHDLLWQLDFGRIAEIGGDDGAAIDVDTWLIGDARFGHMTDEGGAVGLGDDDGRGAGGNGENRKDGESQSESLKIFLQLLSILVRPPLRKLYPPCPALSP